MIKWTRVSWIIFVIILYFDRQFQILTNGETAISEQFPWMVLFKSSDLHCSGFLITSQTVLTAAHCIERKTKTKSYIFTARDVIGSPKQHKRRAIEKKISHPDFEWTRRSGSRTNPYDIAIVRLRHPLKLSAGISTVCLSRLRNRTEPGIRRGTGVGWGISRKKRKRPKNDVTLYPKQFTLDVMTCRKILSRSDMRMSNSQFCTSLFKGGGPCHGDSGGPLVYKIFFTDNYIAVGVLSQATIQKCNQPRVPFIYIAIGFFQLWIKKNVQDSENICFV